MTLFFVLSFTAFLNCRSFFTSVERMPPNFTKRFDYRDFKLPDTFFYNELTNFTNGAFDGIFLSAPYWKEK